MVRHWGSVWLLLSFPPCFVSLRFIINTSRWPVLSGFQWLCLPISLTNSVPDSWRHLSWDLPLRSFQNSRAVRQGSKFPTIGSPSSQHIMEAISNWTPGWIGKPLDPLVSELNSNYSGVAWSQILVLPFSSWATLSKLINFFKVAF